MATEEGQKDKQWSTKHYTENKWSSNTNLTTNRGWTRVLRKGKLFLLHYWHSVSCYKFQRSKKKMITDISLSLR